METGMDLKVRRVQLIIDQVDNLPTLSVIATQVLALAASSQASIRNLADIIESDPSLASRILSLVNSASFGGVKSVSTVSRACSLLGFEAIRNSVLSLKVFDLFSRKGSNAFRTSFDRTAFWKHALGVAAGAQLIARCMRGVNPEEAFVAGLLHDIGKVALDFVLPKTFDQVVRRVKSQGISFAEAENSILSVDHTVVGKRLTENWRFPEQLVNVVWLHHQASNHLPRDIAGRDLVRVVHLADLLARERRIGMSGPVFGPERVMELAEQLRIPMPRIETISKELHSVVAQHVQIMGLEQTDERDLFHESLQNANAELGAINEKLLWTTRRLQRQKRQAEILAEVSRSAGCTSSVRDQLKTLCRVMSEWLETEVCAVYVLGGRGYVEGALKAPGQTAGQHFIFEGAASDVSALLQPDGGPGNSGLARAERSEAWLFERLGTAMGQGPFYTLPIFADSERLGAFVFRWPNEKTEPRQQDCRELEAIANSAALAVSLLYQRQQAACMLENLADANRRAAEAHDEMVRKRSLASVGAMAAGAAHEINNPLAVISGRAQILAETESDQQKCKALMIIVEQAERASGIISEMMSFAYPLSIERRMTDITAIARKVVETRSAEPAGVNIVVELEEPEQSPVIANVDGRQVQWALDELVSNASRACGTEGRITLRLEPDESNRQLSISVTDTGSGMDHETLARACDPFFCGRMAGRGVGLGLAKVQRIADAHRGSVHLESASGQGTVARLVFDLEEVPQPVSAAHAGRTAV